MDNKNNGFSYTYSAEEQSEIRKIREKYVKKEEKEENEDKMTRLRRLDAKVTRKAQTLSLIFGVIGVLILGCGMSLIMTEFGEILGKYYDFVMPIGIAIGVIGGILAGVAYPVYNFTVKKERAKIADEIIKLTDELMK